MKQLASTVSSSLSIACACCSCILLLLLEVEVAESRLIWIPRAKDVNQGSSKYTKVVSTNDHKMVSKANLFPVHMFDITQNV